MFAQMRSRPKSEEPYKPSKLELCKASGCTCVCHAPVELMKIVSLTVFLALVLLFGVIVLVSFLWFLVMSLP